MSSAGKRKWDDVQVKDETEEDKKPFDPVEAAAQAAAIAARIASTIGGSVPSSRPSAPVGGKDDKKDVYDGQFTHDIDINDLRNRYMITKGATQQQLSAETGASITTKGTWYPDRSKAEKDGGDPPLYLHIAAPSKEVLDKAIEKVNELIQQDLPPLLDERTRFHREQALGPGAGGPPPPGGPPRDNGWGSRFGGGGGGDGPGVGGGGGRGRWPEEKVLINLESMRNFNVRAKVVGPGGMFVKFIQGETGTRVQIKGNGSGFIETETGREADEPMHINIAGPNPADLVRAKELAEDLLEVVREEYQKAVAQAANANFASQNQNQGQGQGQGYGGGGYGGQQGQGQGQGQGGQQADPYAAYGGYAAYAAQYAAQYGQQAGGADASASSQPPLPTGPSPAAGTPATGAVGAEDPAAQYEAYRAYWAAYGYDVNDPQFQAWLATQQPGVGGAPIAPSA